MVHGWIYKTTLENPQLHPFECLRTWNGVYESNYDYGTLHSFDDKPAWVVYNRHGQITLTQWLHNNKAHRVINRSPATIHYDGLTGEVTYAQYVINGVLMEKEEYDSIMDRIDAMSDTEKLLDPRQWVREIACLK